MNLDFRGYTLPIWYGIESLIKTKSVLFATASASLRQINPRSIAPPVALAKKFVAISWSRAMLLPMQESRLPQEQTLDQDFRAAMRRLASTVTVLTCRNPEGRRFGMTATAVTSVSADPPSVLICVNRSAAMHAHLERERLFCINLLRADQQAISEAFSGLAEGESRFQHGNWASDADGVPYLANAQANIFCSVEEAYPHGTHGIFIGRVRRAKSDAGVNPLIYQDGAYMRTVPLG